MHKKIIFILIFLINFNAFSQIKISELMPAPKTNEPEWIEFYNNSDNFINSKSWQLSNYNSRKQLPEFNFQPHKFTVLTKDTTLLKTLRKVPESTILIQFLIPSLHNGADTISIFNSDSIKQDCLIYNSTWTSTGISLERIDYDASAEIRANIGKCLDKDSTTIGRINSISLKDHNFIVDVKNDSTILIKNIGKRNLESIKISAKYNRIDENQSSEDSLHLIALINQMDSAFYVPNFANLREKPISDGLYEYLITLSYSALDTTIEISKKLYFYKSYSYGKLLINEFLPNPTANNGEFIEIYNTTKDTIYLRNYQITGKDSKEQKDSILINCLNCFISPKDYFVVTNDTSLFTKYPELKNSKRAFYKKSTFSLSTTKDHIGIIDYNGQYLDTLNYTDDWYNSVMTSTKDISIEKKSKTKSSNDINIWIASKDSSGATPGRVNSYNIEETDSVSDSGLININPNPFSRNSQFANGLIEIKAKKSIKEIKLIILNTSGQEITQLIPRYFGSLEVTSSWDGRDKNSILQDIGPYILIVQIKYHDDSEESYKKLIVIGE